MLNNTDLQCLPRAEINNSLTGEVGKRAVRDCGSGRGWRREPGGGGAAEWLEAALGKQSVLLAAGQYLEGWMAGIGEGQGVGLGPQREDGLCDQTDLGSHRLSSSPWTSFSQLWSYL